MDVRKFVQGESGGMHAFGADPAERAAAAGVYWVREEIALGRLDQKCGVIDPGCADGGRRKGRSG